MAFTFGFSGQDFSDDDIIDAGETLQTTEATKQERLSALDTLSQAIPAENMPQVHSLEALLATLVDVRLTFDNYTTPGGNVVYRRELFDVKHQVMTEDDTTNQTHKVLIEENNNDLQKNVYEGGFKSWECSYDEIDKLNAMSLDGYSSFLDLGCGTALPTCFLLLKRLQSASTTPTRYILSDFNYDVLRLVTLPNLIIHWASLLPVETLVRLTTNDADAATSNDEVLVTPQLIAAFQQDLRAQNIAFKFVSGSWGNQFNALLHDDNVDFIISSETIYSPETLPVVAESIVAITEERSTSVEVHVAAKNIYFGVGGSVHGFLEYFNTINNSYTVTVDEVNDQLKRSIVVITRTPPSTA